MEILVLILLLALLGVFFGRATARLMRVLDALYVEMRVSLDRPSGEERESGTPWARPPRPLWHI